MDGLSLRLIRQYDPELDRWPTEKNVRWLTGWWLCELDRPQRKEPMEIRVLTDPTEAMDQLAQAFAEQKAAATRKVEAETAMDAAKKELDEARTNSRIADWNVGIARGWLDYALGVGPKPSYCGRCDSVHPFGQG